MSELIDRLSLIDKLDQGQKKALDAKDFMSFYALVYFKVILQEAPTIEPEVRHGRWILIGRSRITKSRDLKCSVCGNYFRVYDDVTLNAGRGDANFCPNCGAYMRGRCWQSDEMMQDGE